MLGIFNESVTINQEWTGRLATYTEMNRQAQRVNAPGNDVFHSKDVSLETARLSDSLSAFRRQSAQIREDLETNVEPAIAGPLLLDLQNVDLSMTEMVTEARQVLKLFGSGRGSEAAEQMATMDHKYANVNHSVDAMNAKVLAVQGEFFAAQLRQAVHFERYGYGIAGLVFFMVLGLAGYGNKVQIVLTQAFDASQRLRHELEAANAVAKDVSSANAAASESTKQRKELLQLIDTANAPIFGIDTDGNVNEWNATTALITGFSKTEAMGQPLVKTFIDDDRKEAVQEVLQKALEGEQTANYELPLTTKDGRVRYLLINATTRRDVDGHISGVVGVAQDITEVKIVHERIEQLNVLKGVFIAMHGTVAYEVKHWGEADEEIVWVEGATEQIFGITHEEWTQGAAFEFVKDEDSHRKASEAAALIAKGEPAPMVELQATHKDGNPVVVMLDKISRHLPNGNLLIVNHDITAEVKLRELTKKHVIQKAIASRFKAATAYLSHEIRNQLYPQSMILEILQEDVPEYAADVNLILDANATVTSILNHVLELAKWESGEFPIDAALFPMKRLFKSVAHYGAAKGATIRGVESIKDTWYVKADEHILKQACTNLISNADKFRANSPVTVTFSFEQSSRKAGTLVVVVEDGGRGMTPDQLKNVMVPFGQIRKAGEQRSGTGLGLPLTKAMIEVGHGGNLTVESAGLGEGTRATVRVPVAWLERRESPKAHGNPMWWVTVDPDAAIDVLIVDDAPLNRKVTANACTRLGLTHEEAEDGQQAVEMMALKKYSMVTMDRQMPVMNGDEAVETARKAGYDGPIVMVSGDTLELSEQADMRERGVTAFLQKMAVPGVRDALKQLALKKKNIGPT